jgi:iron complex transport system ATP-binding protein
MPESGVIKVCGTDIHTLSQNRVAQLISLVPQEQMDIFPYAVLDVVVMGRAPYLTLAQRPSQSDYCLAAQALDRLNAGYLAPRNFNRISGGERQISLLARALVQAGHLMLLDEPTNHLDFNNQYHLLGTIKTLCREKGISMIASMHDPNLAAFFADAVVMIKNGEILARGNARDVMTAENISTLYDTDTSGIRLTENCRLFFPDHLLNRK